MKNRYNSKSAWESKDAPILIGAAALGGVFMTVVAKNFFGNEKKITHAIRTDYAVSEETFLQTVSHLLGPALVDGNRVELLRDAEEIYPAMLEAIRSATKTITFENFVFREGKMAWEFAAALAERAVNGVKVHFLQDAMGCNCVTSQLMSWLVESGVDVEVFRTYRLARFNQRTHRKILVIDGKVGFIGGVGIADEWVGHGNPAKAWRDNHYRVFGPVVSQMQQAFLDNWMQTRAEVLHGEDYFPLKEEKGNYKCQVFRSSAVEGSDSARLFFLFTIAAAKRTLKIANAYFIPDDLLVQTIVEAAERGVKVEIITSGRRTDESMVRFVGRARWGKLLDAGVLIYEYLPRMFHCKYMVADEVWTSVGSCNFDNRSLRLNDEANLNVHNEEFGQLHTRIFDEDKAESRLITKELWERRPLWEKVGGNIGCLLRSQL